MLTAGFLYLKIMDTNKIQKLVKELCDTKVKYKSYDGSMSETTLIERNNETILEQIIRQHILDNRDEKQGVLEAKVFMYEQIISKSTFAPMLVKEEKEVTEYANYVTQWHLNNAKEFVADGVKYNHTCNDGKGCGIPYCDSLCGNIDKQSIHTAIDNYIKDNL